MQHSLFSHDIQKRLKNNGILFSINRKGDYWDNNMLWGMYAVLLCRLRLGDGADNRLMEAFANSLPHPFSNLNEQKRGEWRFCGVAGESNKELEIRILLDLLHGLFVGQTEFVLDYHRADNHSGILGWTPLVRRQQALVIRSRQIILGDEVGQLHPSFSAPRRSEWISDKIPQDIAASRGRLASPRMP